MENTSTFSLHPLKKIMPVADLNVSIVHFGYQEKDETHRQGPLVKTEHVLQYILSGEGFLTIGNKTYRLKAGDLFYLPKNVLLTYYAKPDDPYRYYWLGLDGVSAKELLAKTGFSSQAPVRRYADDRITERFKRIGALLERNDFSGYVAANGEAYALLALLLSFEPENTQKLKSPTDEYVDKAIAYIRHNFANDTRVTDVAKAIGLGRNYFSVIFHRCTGISPVEYLMRYRIFQAEKMLQQGISVTETAMNCGFNSPAHFSVQFKKITGLSPRNYKKR